jgi:CBS domain containing-hemolysin-like protein
MNSLAFLLLLAVGAFAVSFLLSGMEAGLPALNRLRIRRLARQGQSSARLLHGFLTAPEHFLWTILIGNTLASVALLGLAFHRLHTWLGDRRLVLTGAMVGTVFLWYMLADLLPKMLFRQFPTRLCLAMARPFAVVHGVLRPAVRLIAGLAQTFLKVTGGKHFPGRLFQNREELRQLLQESAQSLSGEELGMVNRVLDMQRITVGSLMVPLARVVCAPADAALSEVCRRCRETDHDRLPVLQSGGPGIAGVVSLPTILYREGGDLTQPAARMLEPALYLPEHHPLETALRQFQRSGQRLAVVLDPQRREIGILTLTDILRFIFGEVTL